MSSDEAVREDTSLTSPLNDSSNRGKLAFSPLSLSSARRHTRSTNEESTSRRRRRHSSSSRSMSPIVTKRFRNVRRGNGTLVSKEYAKRSQQSSSRSVSPLKTPEDTEKSAVNDEMLKDKMAASYRDINIFGKTGGAYIPPARLRQMQAKITDKSSEAYQRIAWEALKKSIHGLINKVNISNIAQVVRQLLSENIVRGRGLLVKSLITSQMASPTFTHIFAALIAVVNTKLPQVGELLLKRLITEFRKAFRRNQKDRCLTTARFLAHLVNQKVADELIVLELLTLLLEQTTDDSVEVSVALLKECGAFLSRAAPKGLAGIFDHLRRILNESQCDKRIAYMIEVLFQIRRDGWRDHPTVLPELDLIEEDDQITHTLSLLDQVDPEDGLNIYRFDPDYEANEKKYAVIRASFLGDNNDEDVSSGSESNDEEGEEENDVQGPGEQEGGMIIDQTETNLVHLRRTIYLMLQSSISADEGAHRLLQLKIKPGEEYEVASMVLDCCAQTRSYETRYGSLAQRLCRVMLFSSDKPKPGEQKTGSEMSSEPPRTYVAQFEKIFGEQYATIHRLETAKLKNVAMFFAHLLFTDSISWGVLECVKLNERDTSSSGRIFLKYLFQELCSFMGLAKLQVRLRDETLQPFFAHLLPRDNPKDTRFAINFLTTIGLGGLTVDLREHLQSTRAVGEKVKLAEAAEELYSSSSCSSSSDSSSSSCDSSDSSSSSSPSSSSSSSESDESEDKKLRKKVEKVKRKVERREPKGHHHRTASPKSRDRSSRRDETTGSDRDDVAAKKSGGDRKKSLKDHAERRRGSLSPQVLPHRRDSLHPPEAGEKRGGRCNRNTSPPIDHYRLSRHDNSPLKALEEKDTLPRYQRRESSPNVDKRRRYNSPSPASKYRHPSPPSPPLLHPNDNSPPGCRNANRPLSPSPRRSRFVSPPPSRRQREDDSGEERRRQRQRRKEGRPEKEGEERRLRRRRSGEGQNRSVSRTRGERMLRNVSPPSSVHNRSPFQGREERQSPIPFC
ncbi:Pre-mRNA-splicing factor CWC22 -like protein [Echinococcus granulosus]|uniref:Pre mRNA splicing factor CWC22 n=1 Tax=Echinococcus granulosus TaxID=6210 RepID=A0A068WLE3_ECHGR|nr:Pre-mRNA-splicing factor CWC22 -like protein [Echinococcus granulosus]CDS20933.1 pre mRNA splicing factor CWC22 [Echinococcus granulosus]